MPLPDPLDDQLTADTPANPGLFQDFLNEERAAINAISTEVAAQTTATAAALAARQPLDSDLTAIAALSTSAFGRSFLALADAAAGRTLLALGTAATAASTSFDAAGAAAAAQAASQPLDSDLTAIAALTTTAYGRSLLEAANAAALRTLAGLGTAAVAATGDFDAAGAAAAAQAASQPLDSDLTAIAALTTTAYGRALLALADAAALRTAAGLVIGTDVQAQDAELAAIAGLTSVADRLPYFTGSGTASLATFTAAGRALVDDADAAAQRTTLGTVAKAGDTFTGEVVVPDLSVSGLTGATAASRHVGATASGAPASGTFSIGDFVIDRTGQLWICTAAGTPGTWIAAGSGNRLGLASSTAGFSTASTSYTDYTGLTVTVTCDGVAGLSLVAYAPLLTASVAAGVSLGIFEGATLLDSGTAQLAASATQNLVVMAELAAPSAGSHTYKVRMKTTAGTATSNEGATFPSTLKAVRC